jgi:DNA-binding PadR family transcriptional regulator
MTYPTAAVLRALSLEYRYGFEIAEVVGLRPGSVYQVLRRLEEAGFVRGEWEPAGVARQQGRPARRYYRLAGNEAEELLEEARRRFPGIDHLPGVAVGAARP